MWWPALGGLAVGLGGWWQPRALGVGYDVIGDLLNHRLLLQAALALLAAKAVMWVLALGSGTSGGVLAPLLMIGAGLGTVLGVWLPGADPSLWPLVCMAAVLSGVLGAPLTATVFAFGLTGDGNALLPLLLACGTAYGLTVLTMPRSIMTERIARRGRHVHREYGVDPLESLHVEDVMTREVHAIPARAPVAEVLRDWFGSGQRHRAMPVVGDAGELLGLLDRETLQQALAACPQAQDAGELARALPPAQVCAPAESCRAAAERMAWHGLARLPVVDSPGSRRLVGIVSRSDLIEPARRRYEEERVRERLLLARERQG
jgi:CBS domain-containing protein